MPTCFFDRLYLSSSYFAARFDHFPHAGTATRAEIVTAADAVAESQNVRVGKIEDMNVIANTRSIGRVVVRAVDFDIRFFTKRRLKHIRNEMCLRSMVFAKFLRCARGIEVPKANKFHSMNLVVPAQNFFEGEFGFAIRTDGTRLRCFINWHPIWRTKDCAG